MSFYQKAVYISIGLIIFNLCLIFVSSIGSFGSHGDTGIEINSVGDALSVFTSLEDASMQGVFLLAVGLTGIGAVALAWLTHSITPVGIHIFSIVFWTSYTKTHILINSAGYIPFEFMIIVFVGMIFLFIAAIVGMLTGSG